MWCCSKSRSTRSRTCDGSLCAITVCRAHSASVTSRLSASGCDGCTSITSSSCPSTIDAEPRLGGLERQHAEVEAALRDLGAHLAGRDAAHIDVHERVAPGGSVSMSGSTAWTEASLAPDQDAAAAQVPEVLDGRLGFLRQPEQPLGIVAQEPARLGERGVLGGAVEQPFADALLQPPDRLADGRLRPVQLHRGPGEAALGGDASERP